jgi:hypothetical protein
MQCIVPQCTRDATNNLGIRLRRRDTSAIWAPNTEAHVCDHHAVSGARLNVFYEATATGEVEIHVHGSTHEVSRSTPIRRELEPVETLTQRVRDTLES